MSQQTSEPAIAADDTAVFKRARIIENGLAAKLSVLVNRIKRASDSNSQFQRESNAAYAVIRSGIQRTYIVGAEYVTKESLLQDFYLAQSDLDRIKQLALDYKRRFDFRVNNYLLNREEPLSTDFIADTFAGFVVSRVLNIAIKEKAAAMVLGFSLKMSAVKRSERALLAPQEPYFPQPVKQKEIQFFEKHPGFEPTFLAERPAVQLALQWLTALDDKVCPICAPLQGTIFQIGDPSIPEPDDSGTHFNCRCVLQMIEI